MLPLLGIIMHINALLLYYTWLDYTIPLLNTTARNQCLTYISIASIKLFYNVYYTKIDASFWHDFFIYFFLFSSFIIKKFIISLNEFIDFFDQFLLTD